MYNSFFSFLHFQNQFTNSEIELIKESVKDLQLSYLERFYDTSSLSEKTALTTYSYIVNYESYKELLNSQNSDTFIVHSVDKPTYIKFELAIQNIFRFYPNKTFLDFEEVKALNIMDKILIPLQSLKTFLKSNSIDENKIYFLPLVLKFSNPIYTSDKNKIICYCNFENDLWKNCFKELENLNKKINFELDIYIENNKFSFEETKKIIHYYLKTNFNLIDSQNFTLDKISQKTIYIKLSESFEANIKELIALGNEIPVINFESLNNIENIFINYEFYKEKTLNISKKIKKIYSKENFKTCFKKLIKESFEQYNHHRNFLLGQRELSKDEYKNLNSTKKLAQLIKQIENTKHLVLNEVFENLSDDKIKDLMSRYVKRYEYIIISCKSENYPQKNYRSKDDLINLLSDFEIIQNTYYGNPEFKLAEKEFFIIVIKANIKNSKDIKYVTWEGSQFFYNSLAVINKELELKFDDSKNYEISVIPQDSYAEITAKNYPFFYQIENLFNKILLKKTNFFIRHSLPANFNSPSDGYYILIFPWETGYIPKPLVEHINKSVDQLWCPSNYVKELHKNSGVLPYKLKLVPNGINPEIYNPSVKPIDLKTNKKFKFLFLGGLVFRKGIDILLQAYEEEFTRDDDVCLVLKGLGDKTYYKQDSFAKRVLDFEKDETKAELLFIDNNISIMEMGKIYTSCQSYVQPYRAEGFGMPITEAMACSLAVIVTNFGASLDFCNKENSLLLNYNIKTEILKDVDGIEKETSYIEPDKEHLKKLMRYAFENQDKIKELGKQAHQDIMKNFTWDSVFNIIENCFLELKDKPIFRNNIEERIHFLTKELEYYINSNNKNKVSSIIYELDILLAKKDNYLEVFANAYYFLDENKKALEYLLILLKKYPKNKDITLKTAKTLEKLGDINTAQALYNIL